jgi:phosphatidate cytidylyltransferase
MGDLTKRVISGVVLAAVLLGGLWLGSWWYLALLVVGGLIVFYEYMRLVSAMALRLAVRAAWLIFGVTYIGLAFDGLWRVRAMPENGPFFAAWLFLVVWATDIGAYVFGRTIGGPKIAPSISPSKTWAGLFGGMVFVVVVVEALVFWSGRSTSGSWTLMLGVGLWAIPLAVLAQAGDFFQSWMKRRAKVKDSGNIIPGHGGLFDRVDGLLPVAIVFPYWMALDL